MKRYRFKPRFFVITGLAVMLTVTGCIATIDNNADRPETAYTYKAPQVYTQNPAYEKIGDFDITHYCACEQCCGKSDGITYTGTTATPGRTIAVDPAVIPLGSTVYIDGQAYVAEDIGGGVKGNHIDVFCASHDEALEKGIAVKEVYREA